MASGTAALRSANAATSTARGSDGEAATRAKFDRHSGTEYHAHCISAHGFSGRATPGIRAPAAPFRGSEAWFREVSAGGTRPHTDSSSLARATSSIGTKDRQMEHLKKVFLDHIHSADI